jgi:phospholipid/cholesterol/gamma-HCH transport system ATP-binding protein
MAAHWAGALCAGILLAHRPDRTGTDMAPDCSKLPRAAAGAPDGPVPTRPDNLVEIAGVHFSFGTRAILTDLNMTVPRGKLVVIMGGSGSGKTTVLRLIGGMLTPQSGQIRIDNVLLDPNDTANLYALRRKMGMLFQQGALFTDLTAFDNVAFPLREDTDLPESMIRDLVLLKLQVVGLRNAAGMKPAEMSGGMARRVALARAIALDPPLVMYDEPFAGLDPIAKGVIANLIRTLNDALGLTSIVVSHDVQESLAMADSIYFLSGGSIIAHGTPAQIRASQHPYVVQFIHGAKDGPVPFDYPGPTFAEDLGLAPPPAG